MKSPKTIHTILGAVIWLVALAGLATGLNTVRARASRLVHTVRIAPGPGHGLAPGDLAFFQTTSGLKRAGEVARVSEGTHTVTLALHPAIGARLNATAHAICWRTPLSAEQAIIALLPPVVQRKVADQLALAWQVHENQLAALWGPLIAGLAMDYLNAVGDDFQAAIERHSSELWDIAQEHGEHFAVQWPIIQSRLRPILQEHLTPVLGRLIHEAVDRAPKMRIAWSIARGDGEEAFRRMLDSLADYLAEVPEEDRAELAAAVQHAWEAAGRDQTLAESLGRIGHAILQDEELRRVLTGIYRETVADNPRTEEFYRTRILESPQFRRQLYAFMELIGPTVQRVAAICLFDERGATRPEVVHLVRSIALGRRVSWVTLEVVEPGGEPLPPDALIAANVMGPAS